jgi:endonuclease/exonuclease/phosphatase family metal-dependent hydrolase
MDPTIYVGLAVSSHVSGTLAAANFSGTVMSPATLTSAAPPQAPVVIDPPPTGTQTSLRLLHWNVHHGGVRTDGVYDPARIAQWIAQISPDIASLNEVDNTDQVNAIVSRLNAITGHTWYTMFGGAGNLLISRLPVDITTNCTYNASYPRVSPHMTVTVNGRPLNVFSTHLAVDSATTRLAEVKAMQACAASWPEAHVLAGDYNALPSSAEYAQAVVGYGDAWKTAQALGTAVNYPGNCDGCTRGGRIDYVFTSTAASFLKVKSAEIIDTRDAAGVMASDHKPLVIMYQVN